MNTNDILRKCVKIPGISLKSNKDSLELYMKQPNGKGSMTFFSIFPGISLAYIFINSPTWPMPDLTNSKDSFTRPLMLNYCITGRCELFSNNSTFVYLKEGELSIAERSVQEQYTYPLRIYEGLEFSIDIDIISKEASYIKKAFNIDIKKLINIYCSLDTTYICQCPEDIKQILLKIWKLYDEDSSEGLFMMQLYTLELLKILLQKEPIIKNNPTTFFTATQVEIAQKTESIITNDLRQHHPARELAKLFSISETSLKNYFRGIYGKNISVYLRELRMNVAATMLEKTKMPISKIAEEVGYMNQSKFASVFKLQYNMSPLEYRRKKNLEQLY